MWAENRTVIKSFVRRLKSPLKLTYLGIISPTGEKLLVKLTKNVDAKYYIEILKSKVKPWLERVHPHGGYVLYQDGHPAHYAKETMQFFRAEIPEFIQKDMRPANRPDLNPIEHMWPPLVDAVDVAQPTQRKAMQKIVRDAWNKISAEFVTDLYASMDHRMVQVIQRDGGMTDY